MGPRQFLEGLKGREEGFRGRGAVKSKRQKEGLQTQDEEHQRHEKGIKDCEIGLKVGQISSKCIRNRKKVPTAENRASEAKWKV